ncbi:MAG: heme lyase CcmF/NrfE family subunit [Actinomycetota bacterium]
MNVVLGDAGIVLALAASVVAAVTIVIAQRTGDQRLLRTGTRVAWIVIVGAIVAFVALERALITRDFTVLFVFENGSHRTPALFNFATLWAALEGSIVLWGLVLAGYLGVVLVKFRNRVDDPLVGWAIVVMLGVCTFFFGLMVGPADPFQEVVLPPGFVDGPGPNPLLQNHLLMAVHPPMLYLGYVGFTVPFAFALAALITGRVGEGWLVETRRWTLFAWGFLTLGIVLGAWWSYDVLGWGGYWGWDPVENMSFLPWLTGTAYLHSVMIQERRGMLRVWNLSLLCATFGLTILGSFVTRSGVLESVHAFSEGSIGPAFLGFFALISAVTIGLIGWRGDRLRAPGRIDSPLSREGSFLANNVLFAIFAFVILLGTVFPLIVEALRDDRISVGVPYFERMTMPVGMVMLFLMAVAPVLPWRKASGELLRHRLQWPAWLGVLSMLLAVLFGGRGLTPLIAFGLAGFAGGAALRQIVLATRRNGWRGLVGRTNGGMIVHLGVIIVAVAFAASNSYLRQSEFTLAQGETIEFADTTIRFDGIETEDRSEKRVTAALLHVSGETLKPAINQFVSGTTLGTPATAGSFTRDIQLALIALPDDAGDEVVIRVTIQPLISWLWIGGVLVAVGTVFSAFPHRIHRRPIDPVSAPVGESAKGPDPKAAPAETGDAAVDLTTTS